jgi:hypothetical protein
MVIVLSSGVRVSPKPVVSAVKRGLGDLRNVGSELRSAVLGGIGARAMSDKALDRDSIANGLVVDDPKSIADRTARQFRRSPIPPVPID